MTDLPFDKRPACVVFHQRPRVVLVGIKSDILHVAPPFAASAASLTGSVLYYQLGGVRFHNLTIPISLFLRILTRHISQEAV